MSGIKLQLLIFSCVLALSFSCNGKIQEVHTEKVTVKDSLTDLDYLEGKVVQSTTGEWFIIKDGFVWRTKSEAATNNYLKSIEDGQNHILKNVPQSTLDQLSVAGEILPNLQYDTENK